MSTGSQVVEIDYTNWRGERTKRHIVPYKVVWAKNKWHPEHQWLLHAFDVRKQESRLFALASIHSWTPAPHIGLVKS